MKPNYMQIKEELEHNIKIGKFKIGERLPSEFTMAKSFKVSRETFRAAIKLLEQDGKVLVKHGIGTFVVNPLPQIPSSLEKLQSIGKMIKLAGLHESEEQELIGQQLCKKEWAQALSIKEGSPVIALERYRTANGEPVAYSLNIIPVDLVGDAFVKQSFQGSLLDFLEDECNIRIERADSQLVVPQKKDVNVKKLLINPNTTVLLIKQLHYDETNKPIFYSYDYYRNDIFTFWVRRKRD